MPTEIFCSTGGVIKIAVKCHFLSVQEENKGSGGKDEQLRGPAWRGKWKKQLHHYVIILLLLKCVRQLPLVNRNIMEEKRYRRKIKVFGINDV